MQFVCGQSIAVLALRPGQCIEDKLKLAAITKANEK